MWVIYREHRINFDCVTDYSSFNLKVNKDKMAYSIKIKMVNKLEKHLDFDLEKRRDEAIAAIDKSIFHVLPVLNLNAKVK